MEKLAHEPITTRRLTLRPVDARDGANLFQYFTDAVAALMLPKPARSLEEAQQVAALFMAQSQAGTDFLYAVTPLDEDVYLGLVGIHGVRTGSPSLGVWFKIGAQRQGYGKEALSALIAHWAARLPFERLVYCCHEHNTASRALATALGGVHVDTHPDADMHGNKRLTVVYHINC